MAISISLGSAGQLLLTIPGPGGSSKSLQAPPDARGLETILQLLERQKLWGQNQPWLDHAKSEHDFQLQVLAKRLPPRDKRIALSGESALKLGLVTLEKLGIGAEAQPPKAEA